MDNWKDALRSLGQTGRDHHAFLLRNKEKADKAYDEFVRRTLAEYNERQGRRSSSTEAFVPDPKSVTDLEEAWEYTLKYVLGNGSKRRELAKLIEQQASMERVWTKTFTRFTDRGEKTAMLEGFYNDCLNKLEKYATEAHAKLQELGVPIVVNTARYADLSEDGKTLIIRIQDALKS